MATALSSTPALLDVQLPNLITVCWVPQGAAVQKKKKSQKVFQCTFLEPMLWLIESEALTCPAVLYLSFHPSIYLSVGVSISILNRIRMLCLFSFPQQMKQLSYSPFPALNACSVRECCHTCISKLSWDG